jgi:ATP-dependent RNA helicase DBP3
MGKKNGAVVATEAVAEEQTNNNNNTELKSSKKNKKNKNKYNLQTEENTPKRKHEELNNQNDTESEKKSKKKKKHNKSDENDTGNGVETVSASDEPITVTGKNAKDEKYAAVKTFVGSGLPDNVLECCKGFEKPSPIQSRAWPFLLDGRDLIGIAATGSG